MGKDFDGWNKKKKEVQHSTEPPFAHEREIWWCTLGLNIGSEQDGVGMEYRRPVWIVRGFSQSVVFVVALTGRRREGFFYMALGLVGGRESSAILSQVRLVDSRRLVRKIETLNETLFETLKTRLRNVLLP